MPSHGLRRSNVAAPQVENKSPSRSKDREGIFCVRVQRSEKDNRLFCAHSLQQNPSAGTPRRLLRGTAKKPVTVRHVAAVGTLSLVRQQRHLALHSTGIAPQRIARPHDSVTRHKNRNGVAPHGACHGAHSHRWALQSVGHAEGQSSVRQGRGERHVEQLSPHGQLKWRAVQIEIRQGRQRQKPREVSAQPSQRCFDKGRLIRNLRVRQVPFQGNALRPGFRLVRHGAMAFALEP